MSLIQERCKHRHTRETHPNCFPLRTKSGAKTPKVLLFDIETAPMKVFVWGLYKQRISPSNVISDFFVLSWSAKWLFSDEIMSEVLTPDEALDMDDSRILKRIWKLFNEADVVIAHNGNGFDIPKLNSRFIINGYGPTLPYKSIDTLAVAKRVFSMSSNSLDYLAKVLGLPTLKLHPGFTTWVQCMDGDQKALDDMETYNKNDVIVLEDVYVKLRPWIKSHPNMALYVETDQTVCPACTSNQIKWEGQYATARGLFKTFRCSCGAIGRSATNSLSKDKRKVLSSSVSG